MISVIVPNYNYAHYLDQRLDSIFNQTYKDIEVIILDDASTDSSINVIEKYRSRPEVSHIVINERNTGSPFQQWMKGIHLAKGEWIWIAEADDLARPTFLETCMKHIQMYGNVSVCYVDSLYIDKDNRPLPTREHKYENTFTAYNGPQFANHYLYWGNAIANASSAVFRKEYALQIKNQTFLNMRYCGDWMFWFEMALQGTIINIHEKLNLFRQHVSQTTKGKSNGQIVIESIQIVKYIEKIFPQIDNSKRKQCYGRIGRYIRHIQNSHTKEELIEIYRQKLESSFLYNYYFFKIHRHLRFVPWLVSEERDRMKAVKG